MKEAVIETKIEEYKVSITKIVHNNFCVGYKYFINGEQIAQSFWNGFSIIGAVREDFADVLFFSEYMKIPIDDFEKFVRKMYR